MSKEFGKNAALDAALISAAQKVEHYEIATYGTLCTWAKELGFTRALSLLKENLHEEKETDEKLTSLAASLNREAAMQDTEKASESSATLSKLVSSGP
jgi:ferritin-like metal-binding protein YciE